MLKQCSKCKLLLAFECFAKSPRHSYGLYPSCKQCQRKVTVAWISRQIVCSRCKKNPPRASQSWCDACRRVGEVMPEVPKFRKTKNPDRNYCVMCQERSPTDYGAYCRPCASLYLRNWNKSKAGIESRTRPEKKRKSTARAYINGLFRRGKIKRKPCEHCGAPSVHFHHLDYKDRTTNIEHLCHRCHVIAERQKRLLTNPLLKEYWLRSY